MNTPMKPCTKCSQEFPATTEYFYKHNAPNGLRPDCKECVKARRKSHYKNNRKKVDAANQAWRDANLERSRKLSRDATRRWRKRNPGSGKESARKYYYDNRKQEHERQYDWRRRNPVKWGAIMRNRRARTKNADGSHTEQDIINQYNRQKGRCHWCDKKVGDTYHVDHVVPLSRGGSNAPDNLVITCPYCNQSKNDKLPHEWSGSGGKLL